MSVRMSISVRRRRLNRMVQGRPPLNGSVSVLGLQRHRWLVSRRLLPFDPRVVSLAHEPTAKAIVTFWTDDHQHRSRATEDADQGLAGVRSEGDRDHQELTFGLLLVALLLPASAGHTTGLGAIAEDALPTPMVNTGGGAVILVVGRRGRSAIGAVILGSLPETTVRIVVVVVIRADTGA